MADGSVIGQTTVVRGNVRGEGSVEIYGRVEGDVSVTGDVLLGEGGSVRGSVAGARLTIGGSVQGDLSAALAVALGVNAQVSGDIVAPRVGMEEGAQFNGAVRMASAAATGSLARAAEPRRAPPRPVEVPRAQPPKRVAPASAPQAAPKKMPPAPVVPALRRGLAKKKSRRL